MKKFIVILAVIMMFPMYSYADRNGEEQVFLHKRKKPGGHLEYYPTADMPDVYYDSYAGEIIIISDGFSSYYDVVIVRDVPLQTVISTQISGYGDTIDVSSLSSGNYTIYITTEYNNEFEGHFTIV